VGLSFRAGENIITNTVSVLFCGRLLCNGGHLLVRYYDKNAFAICVRAGDCYIIRGRVGGVGPELR
jgi:hypothetical protein